MSLVKEWRSAKRAYDTAHKQAQREIKPLQAARDAVEYYLDALRLGKLDDEQYMGKIRAYLDEFSPETILQSRRAIERELVELRAVDARPPTGLEAVLSDLELVLGAAEKLVNQGEIRASSWNKYREIYEGCAQRLMLANDKFEAFSSRRANMEAKLAIRLDHAKILKQVGQRSRAVHVFLTENEIAG